MSGETSFSNFFETLTSILKVTPKCNKLQIQEKNCLGQIKQKILQAQTSSFHFSNRLKIMNKLLLPWEQ